MRVEITEESLKDEGYNLVGGDIITVSDEIGAKWCSLGWAKDTEGKVKTGERRVVGEVTLDPQASRHTVSGKEV